MFTGRPERLRAFTYLGAHRYFLTFCTINRAPLFVHADAVAIALEQIERAAGEERFAVLAYCFMPDHLHLLAEGLCESSHLKAFVKRAKQYSGYYYSQRYRARLWQRYVYEHVVRDDETVDDVVRYIVENPVRAGLVERVADYRFVGSLVTARDGLFASLRDPGPA